MAVQVLVNAVDVTTLYVPKSLSIRQSGSQGIVTCDVSFNDLPGTAAINLEHVLRVLNGGVEVFEGKIKRRGRSGTPDPGPSPKKVYKVQAQDYTHLLTQDVIDATLLRTGSRTDKAEVEYLITTYGTKGITVGTTVQSTGTITRDIDYTGMNLYEALEEASKWLGTGFYVDSNLAAHWFVTEANAAAFNLSDVPNNTTTFGYLNLDMQDDSLDLVNAVWVVGTGITQWETDAASITTYGRIETTLRDPDITTAGQATTAGQGFLLEHAYPVTPISLDIFKDGLSAGMTIQVTNALWGLTSVTYRVAGITAKHNGNTSSLVYSVDLDSRPVDMSDLLSSAGRQIAVTGGMVATVDSGLATIAVDLSGGGGNLVNNSSFESGSTGSWTVGSVWTFGYAPTAGQLAFHGIEVARLVAIGAATGELATTNFIAVAKSDWYNLSWWSFLRSRTAGNYKVVLREYNAAGTLLATTTNVLAAVETEWTRHIIRMGPNTQIAGTTAWQATTTKIKIAFFADTTPTGTWDVDGVQLERSKLVTAYAPAPQELIDNQVTATQIAALTVSLAQLAPLSVDATKITTGAVTTPKIAANAVTANEIAALTITAAEIAAGAITTVKINALAVDATKIAASAIVAGKIAAGTITATELAANSVTTAKLDAGAITLYDNNGQTALGPSGFGETWVRFIANGLYNGDFLGPPPTTGSDINSTTNIVPFWPLTQNVGLTTTARWTALATVASGSVLRFSKTATAALDSAYVEQIVPVPGGPGNFSYRVLVNTQGGVTGFQAWVEAQYLTKAGAAIGTADNQTAAAVGTTQVYASANNGIMPATAYYLRVRVGAKRTSLATAATIDIVTVSILSGQRASVFPDLDATKASSLLEYVGSLDYMRMLMPTANKDAFVAEPYLGLTNGQMAIATATTALTLTTTSTLITGLDVTLAYTGSRRVVCLVIGVIDFNVTTVGVGNCVGILNWSGNAVLDALAPSTAQIIHGGTSLGRGTVAQVWIVTLGIGNGPAYRFWLSGSKTINAGVAVANTLHSRLMVFPFPTIAAAG